MGELQARRTAWSVTLRSMDPVELEGAFDGFHDTCADVLADRFPEAMGYETRQFRLSGPVEGTRFEVTRGRFRGLVSAQRFRRSYCATGAGAPLEVRLVASTEIAPRPGSVREASGLSLWSVAGCAIGTVTLGTLGLGVAGLVSTWGQALVLIPALVAWRTCTAISLSNSVTPMRALPGSIRASDPLLEESTDRWNQVVRTLEAHRRVLDQPAGAAPFRNPATPTLSEAG